MIRHIWAELVDIDGVESPKVAIEFCRPLALGIAAHEVSPNLVVLANLETWIVLTLALVDDYIGSFPPIAPPIKRSLLSRVDSRLHDLLDTIIPLFMATIRCQTRLLPRHRRTYTLAKLPTYHGAPFTS
jgi:hypothetical protein